MRNLWFLDSETEPFKKGRIPEPFIWGLYDFTNEEYYDFYNSDDLINFIEDKEIIIYAHNGGKFDYFYLLNHLEPFGDLMIINGRLSKFKIGLAEFRDSYNLLPVPLSAYKKDDFDYSILEKNKRDIPANKRKIELYLYNDCRYLGEIVTRFINAYGLNLTLAGTALKTWSKMSGTKPPKSKKDFFDIIQPYYYGGRVQCFKKGLIDYPFKIVDINSAYPHAMTFKHPYGLNFDESAELPETQEDIERCFITLQCKAQGAFPLRTKDGLCFPDDGEQYEFNVSGWEYIAALDTGTLGDHSITNVIRFFDTIDFFGYVDHFYNEKAAAKKANDKAGYLIAKLLQNSLYGKMGANPSTYSEYTIVEQQFIEAAEQDGYEFSAELGKWALMEQPLAEENQRYFNVAVAASITGKTRAVMWRAICVAGKENVLYCDTDSLATTNISGIDMGDALGQWDLEGKAIRGGIAGKKLYAFEYEDSFYNDMCEKAKKAKMDKPSKYKTASKGVRLNAKEILKVAGGEMVTYAPDAPSYSLKRGINFMTRDVKLT